MGVDIGALYDQLGTKYLEDVERVPPPELDGFMDMLSPKGVVLDVGCAGGRDSERFAKRGFHVIGIDLSNVFIEEAKKRVPEGEFYRQDLRHLNFEDATFDGIWAQAVLLHLEKQEIPSVLNDFRRILKPGGKLHIYVKLGEGAGAVSERLQHAGQVNRLFTYFGKEELEQLISSAGLRVVSSEIVPDALGREGVQWVRLWAEKNI